MLIIYYLIDIVKNWNAIKVTFIVAKRQNQSSQSRPKLAPFGWLWPSLLTFWACPFLLCPAVLLLLTGSMDRRAKEQRRRSIEKAVGWLVSAVGCLPLFPLILHLFLPVSSPPASQTQQNLLRILFVQPRSERALPTAQLLLAGAAPRKSLPAAFIRSRPVLAGWLCLAGLVVNVDWPCAWMIHQICNDVMKGNNLQLTNT